MRSCPLNKPLILRSRKRYCTRLAAVRFRTSVRTQWKGAHSKHVVDVDFFGMSYSPTTFQHFMNTILKPWYKKYGHKNGKSHMDDISIGHKASERALHIAMIHDLYDILTEHRLHLKLSKSTMQPQTDFLGVWVSKDGVTVDPTKIAGLRGWPREIHNLKGARSFIGVVGYHHIFIPNFSHSKRHRDGHGLCHGIVWLTAAMKAD